MSCKYLKRIEFTIHLYVIPLKEKSPQTDKEKRKSKCEQYEGEEVNTPKTDGFCIFGFIFFINQHHFFIDFVRFWVAAYCRNNRHFFSLWGFKIENGSVHCTAFIRVGLKVNNRCFYPYAFLF